MDPGTAAEPAAQTVARRKNISGTPWWLAGALTAALACSVFLAIGLGSAVIPAAETARLLWAALTGGGISAQDVPTYQIIWQIRTPRVLLAAGPSRSARVWRAGPELGGLLARTRLI